MRALIVQHEEATPAGLVSEWLDRRRARVDILRIDLDERVLEATAYDLIVSLGSELAAFDDSVPFVERESRLLREAVGAGVSVLGVCFGGQLMARALGGRSFRAHRPEIGWLSIQTNDPDLIPEGPWFQWHYDTFTPPPGARLIADSEVGTQAYVIGRSLGLQFHPEVTPAIIEGWVRGSGDELARAGVDPDALIQETERRAPAAHRSAMRLFDRFLDIVARAGGQKS